MSQPLGENFYPPEHIIFGKKMSVQNKNLKFLSLVFWKINLSKLTLLFSNFPCYIKIVKQLTDFSKFWTLKKKNTCKPMPFL